MAAGETLLVFNALNLECPASGSALLGRIGTHYTVVFNATTDNSAIFSSVIPGHYGATGIDVILTWHSLEAGGAGPDVDWYGAFERIGEGQVDMDAGDSFDAEQSTLATACPGTIGHTTKTVIEFTNAQIDGLLAKEAFRFKVRRDADTDECVQECGIISVELRENA